MLPHRLKMTHRERVGIPLHCTAHTDHLTPANNKHLYLYRAPWLKTTHTHTHTKQSLTAPNLVKTCGDHQCLTCKFVFRFPINCCNSLRWKYEDNWCQKHVKILDFLTLVQFWGVIDPTSPQIFKVQPRSQHLDILLAGANQWVYKL